MNRRTCFVAYPSRPADLVETVEKAIDEDR